MGGWIKFQDGKQDARLSSQHHSEQHRHPSEPELCSDSSAPCFSQRDASVKRVHTSQIPQPMTTNQLRVLLTSDHCSTGVVHKENT